MQQRDGFTSYLCLKPKDVGVKADIVHEQIHVALKHINNNNNNNDNNKWLDP